MNSDRIKALWILSGLSLVMLFPVVGWAIFHPSYFRSVTGFEEIASLSPILFLSAIGIAVVYIFYTFKTVPFVLARQSELSTLKIVGIVSAFASGIMEELVFRKFLMDWGMSAGLGIPAQMLLSALVFGFAHASWGFIRGEFKIAIPVVLSTVGLSIPLGILYVASGRNVLPCIVAHVLINLVIEPWLILAAVSGKWAEDSKSINYAPSEPDS
ncbi:CPBP family intramembrane metalloprotease [Gammaproteobacteria bacterium]|nr:CPBP family intramembrane metalloprotease [Gammaproteobacteria bacterium]